MGVHFQIHCLTSSRLTTKTGVELCGFRRIAEVIGAFLLLILTGIALRVYFRMRAARRSLNEYRKRRDRKDPFDYLTKKAGSPNHDFTGSPNHN